MHFRRNAQQFADHTSIDGVNELYYAKTWFWKLFWFVTVFTAVILTMYQVVKTFKQFVEMDFITAITPANKDQIKYPGIRLCFLHWMYWVDWGKVANLKFSKSATLYGLSFITKGFSSQRFDAEQAKYEFLQNLHLHNMSRLTEFYTAISVDIITVEENDINGSYFEKRELIFKDPNLMFCYTITSGLVYEILREKSKFPTSSATGLILKFTLFDAKYEHLNKTFITLDEYNYHIAYFLHQFFQYELTKESLRENFSEISLPPLVYPNGYSMERIQILSENENYVASFKVTAHVRKNSTDGPCLENKSSILPDDNCFRKCHVDYFLDKCTCLYLDNAAYAGKDYPENLCPENIDFLPIDNFESINFESLKQDCKEQFPGYVKNDKICIKQCLPACETWSYDCTVTVEPTPNYGKIFKNRKNRTTVFIKYPHTGDVLLLTEIDPWTWEDLIGNIGGLLGIWTGASILSLIQLVYWCCCAETVLFRKRTLPAVTVTNVTNVEKI